MDLWLEDEKFTITKSCLIYVPRGMKHLPLTLKRIDYPIFFWTAGNGYQITRGHPQRGGLKWLRIIPSTANTSCGMAFKSTTSWRGFLPAVTK